MPPEPYMDLPRNPLPNLLWNLPRNLLRNLLRNRLSNLLRIRSGTSSGTCSEARSESAPKSFLWQKTPTLRCWGMMIASKWNCLDVLGPVW